MRATLARDWVQGERMRLPVSEGERQRDSWSERLKLEGESRSHLILLLRSESVCECECGLDVICVFLLRMSPMHSHQQLSLTRCLLRCSYRSCRLRLPL